jgi:ABC-type antimicrobial peptide transport system permease subunit
LIVTPETAEKLGFTTGPGPTVLRNPQRFTSDEVAALDDIRDEHDPPKIVRAEPGSTTPRAVTLINTYPPSNAPSPFVLETILSGVALIFALFVVAVSLALASAETREERDVLSVVGAAPTTMRRTSAQKAIILTVMGALLAIPVGFLPVVVFTRADGRDDPWLVFPWRTVGLLVLAVPLITAAVTGTASTIALRFRPVHVSTMTFD